MNQNELCHYGVKGMKWGVRRYQNKDGSLTDVGKKHIGKQYKKEAVKVGNELQRRYNTMYTDAYNKAVDKMNKGGIDNFNAQQEKKYGKDYALRKGYIDDYQKMFAKEFDKNFNKSLSDFYKSNKNFQKAQKLVEQYDMTKWNDMARTNAETIERLRSFMEKEYND